MTGRERRGMTLQSGDCSPTGVDSRRSQGPLVKCLGRLRTRPSFLVTVRVACKNDPLPSILKCISNAIGNKPNNKFLKILFLRKIPRIWISLKGNLERKLNVAFKSLAKNSSKYYMDDS